jgi:F-type H+-transporting ATPase subunit b
MLTALLASAAPPVDYVEKEGASSFPPFDVSSFTGQLIWLVLTFVPFYFVMSRLVLPKLQKVLDHRDKARADALKLAAEASEKVRLAAEAHRANAAAARTAATEMSVKAGEAAKERIAAHRKTVEAQIAQKVADAENQIADARTKAVKLVPDIAKDVTADIMNLLVSETPDKPQIDKAVAAALTGPTPHPLEKA